MSNLNSIWKRTLSMLLCIIMFTTLLPLDAISVFAEENLPATEQTENSNTKSNDALSENPPVVPNTAAVNETLLINGSSCTGEGAAVRYGDKITFKIQTSNEVITPLGVNYFDIGAEYVTPLVSGSSADFTYDVVLTKGKYELLYYYTYKKDGASVEYTSERNTYYLNVNPVALSKPTITWNNTSVSWLSNTTVNGLTAEAGSYTYTIYKNGTAIESYSNVTTTDTSIDISSIINNNGSGVYSISIKANPIESEKNKFASSDDQSSIRPDNDSPVIIEYKKHDSTTGLLTAKVKDITSGIKSYAFSTSQSDVSESERTTYSSFSKPGDEISLSSYPAKCGVNDYYLHVWDYSGNHTVSSASIKATKVQFHNYYVNNVLTEHYEYLIQGQTKTIDLNNGKRYGYDFKGWYSDSELSSPITVLNDTWTDVYAKWELVPLTISISAPATKAEDGKEYAYVYEKTYDGIATPLTASTESQGATVSYTWVKDDSETKSGSTHKDATRSFKDVSDSGLYTVYASIDTNGDGTPDKETSTTIQITINPKSIQVKAPTGKSKFYGESDPVFEAVIDGIISGDTVSYTISRTSGENVGTYDITVSGEENQGNYKLSFVNSTFEIKYKDISSLAVVEIDDTDYSDNKTEYDGTEKKPNVKVTLSGTTLTNGTDYTLTYSDKDGDAANLKNIGKKKISIFFIGNYSGSSSIEYEVVPKELKDAKVVLDTYSYHNAANTPTLKDAEVIDASTGETKLPSKVTYYYAKAEMSDGNLIIGDSLSSAPYEAGKYCVWAFIEKENSNYTDTTTPKTYFEITSKEIKVIAGSKSFVYDGEAHSYDSYTIDAATPLEGTDSIVSCNVNGTITEIGKAANVVDVASIVLSSSANPSNYTFTAVDGELEVTKKKINTPSSLSWDNNTIGLAKWTNSPISGVETKYLVSLLRNDGTEDVLVKTIETTESSCNFAPEMKAYGTQSKYTFKVKSVITGGDKKDNYADSEVSASSPSLCTIKLVINKGNGVTSACTTDGQYESYILISGDKVNLSAQHDTGYSFVNSVWSADSSCVSFSTPDIYYSDVTAVSSEAVVVNITATATDDKPVFTKDLTAENLDNGNIKLSFTAIDSIGITKWAISTEKDTSKLTWNEISPSAASVSKEMEISSKGEYYAYVSDGTNVITSTSLNIYQITFEKNHASATGTDYSILKAEGINRLLPECTFTLTDSEFNGWIDVNSNIRSANDVIRDDADQTFKVSWKLADIVLTVKYYYEIVSNESTPKYNDTADVTKTFNYKAKDSVTFANDGVLNSDYDLPKEGFTLDKFSPNGGTIVLSENSREISIYYKRNTYNIVFSNSQAESGTLPENMVYKFGYTIDWSSVVDLVKSGYDFSGWYYNDSKTQPSTMPAGDLNVTSYFSSKNITYKVAYYLEDLDGAKYTYESSLTEDKDAYHGKSLSGFTTSADNENVKPVSGFTCYAVAVSNQETLNTSEALPADAKTDGLSGKFDANNSNYVIKYYYKRNTYKLKLNVLLSPREDNKVIYASPAIDVKFGQSELGITDDYGNTYSSFEEFVNYGKVSGSDDDMWRKNYESTHEHALDGYILASFADWTTGEAPETMPACDVTVVREYVLNDDGRYTVRLYLANAMNDDTGEQKYTLVATNYYTKTKGTAAIIGNTADCDVNITKYSGIVSNLGYYDLANFTLKTNQINGDGSYGTYVYGTDDTDPDHKPLVADVYLERKEYTAHVHYYFDNGTGRLEFAEKTIVGKWGEYFSIDIDQYFFANSGSTDPNNTHVTVSNEVKDVEITSGVKGDTYDFQNNNYRVNFADNVRYGNVNIGLYDSTNPNDNFLLRDYKTYIYPSDSGTVVNVFYANTNKTYVVNAYYSDYYLSKSNVGSMPFTVSDGRNTYKLRIVNKCDVIKNTVTLKSSDSNYPGISYEPSNFVYTYTENEYINGFSKLGDTQYYVNSNDNDYAYIIDESNRFYYNYTCSYTYTDFTGIPENAADINAFLETYKSEHGETAEGDSKDPNVNLIYNSQDTNNYNRKIDYEKYNGNLLDSPASYTVYLRYATDTYRLTHVLSEKNYTCSGHVIKNGAQADPYALFNSDSLSDKDKPGYQIVWYGDNTFTSEITKGTTIKMDTNKTVYGRYEKVAIENNGYVLYQLSDKTYVSISSLNDTDYIKQTISEGTETLYDEINKKNIKAEKNVYEYYIKDSSGNKKELAAVEIDIPTLAFTEIKLNYKDYEKKDLMYHFASSNTMNWLADFCQYNPINLKAYVERDNYTLILDKHVSGIEKEITTYLWGEDASVPVLKGGTGSESINKGYDFDGWDLYHCTYNASTDTWTKGEKFTDAEIKPVKDGETIKEYSLAIPKDNIYAQAKWVPSEFDQIINHYFPNENKSYDTALINKLKLPTGSLETGTHAITESGKTIGYYRYTVLSSPSVVEKDGYKLTINSTVEYFDCTEEKNVGESSLIYAQDFAKVRNDDKLPLDEIKKSYSNYDLDYVAERFSGGHINTRKGSEKVTISYPMGIDVYYTPKYPIAVSATVMATDNKEIGTTTVSGTGDYYYKQSCKLSVNLAAGFAFDGWYEAEDILTEGKVNTSLTDEQRNAKKISSAINYQFSVLEEENLVALIIPDQPDKPSVAISGQSDLYFKYDDSNTYLEASVIMPATADSDTVVSTYSWYYLNNAATEEWIKLDETSGKYHFTEEQSGTYTYKCQVTVKNTKNGRELQSDFSALFNVNVKPVDSVLSIQDDVQIYDPSKPVKLTINNPNTLAWGEDSGNDIAVYYSFETFDTSDYSSKTLLTKADLDTVTFTDSDVYEVYYYVKSLNPNYADSENVQKSTITILPKTVTASAIGGLSKIYDGTNALSEDNKTALSSAYVSADIPNCTYYQVDGIYAGDKEKYTIVADSIIYNSANSNDAHSVSLSNIRLVNVDSTKNCNYAFDNGLGLTITGTITPFEIPVKWKADAASGVTTEAIKYLYDNNSHVPVAGYEVTCPNSEKPVISVTPSKESVNVGAYTAYAELNDGDGVIASNYVLTNKSAIYQITKKDITVSPTADETHPESVTYDGNTHTYSSFTTDITLPEGFTLVASSDSSYKDAGTYAVYPVKNETLKGSLKILDKDNKEVTDNYTITYGSKNITINPKTVTVSGITAENKVFDNTNAATIVLSGTAFNGLVEGDELSISAVTGTFDTVHAGDSKTVSLNYDSAVISGKSKDNYTFDKVNSQNDCKAAVTPKTIAVSFACPDVVYGQDITVNPSLESGYNFSDVCGNIKITINNVTVEKSLSNSASIQFAASDFSSPDAKTDAYTVSADVTGLYLPNDGVNNDYVFTASESSLNINKRPLSISSVSNTYSIEKVYDETTAITDANETSILSDSYVLGAVTDNPNSGIYNSETVKLKSINKTSTVYNSADVSSAASVTVNGCTVDDSNYCLANDSYTIGGKITPLPVDIYPVVGQNKIYGSSDPTLTWVCKNGDTVIANSKINSVLVSREIGENVGFYTIGISVTKEHNPNYTITTHDSIVDTEKFEIKQQNLTIKPSGKTTVTYGDKYNSSEFAIYTPIIDGWKGTDKNEYEEKLKSAITGYGYGNSSDSLTALADSAVLDSGNYKIFAILDNSNSNVTEIKKNYNIVLVSENLTVNKKTVKVDSGIKVSDKTYDGNNSVANSNIDVSGAVISGLLDKDTGSVTLSIDKTKVSGTYLSKNVSENTDTSDNVSLVYSDGALVITCDGVKNYILDTASSQSKATAKILSKELTVGVKYPDGKTSLETKYGTSQDKLPTLTPAFTGFVGGDNESNALTGTPSMSYVSYTPQTNAGTDIAVSVANGSLSANYNNYTINTSNGVLKINPDKFQSPTGTWDSSMPGKINWNSIAAISDTAVAKYSLTLYLRNGGNWVNKKTVATDDASTLSYDFSKDIHDFGPGEYCVGIKTISSISSNVQDSDEAKSTSIFAANVKTEYKNDDATNAGKGSGNITILRNGTEAISGTTVCLIAGEYYTASADVKNDTGYSVSVDEDDKLNLITFSDKLLEDKDFNVQTSYSFKASISSTLNTSSEITNVISMTVNKANVDVSITAEYDGIVATNLVFAYEASKVKLIGTPKNSAEKIVESNYTYTYDWSIQKAPYTPPVKIKEQSTEVESDSILCDSNFPEGLVVRDAASFYKIDLNVTAVRKDNGDSITVKTSKILPVAPATLHLTLADSVWTYGETRNYTYIPKTENKGNGTARYFYSKTLYSGDFPTDGDTFDTWISERKTSDGWVEYSASAGGPTEVGTYYIYGYIPDTENFKAAWANADSGTYHAVYTINKAKLSSPQNVKLTVDKSSVTYYGIANWDNVTKFLPEYYDGTNKITNSNDINLEENKGISPASHIDVSYTVDVLYQSDASASTVETVAHYAPEDITSNVDFVFTKDLTKTGIYTFKIKAVSSNEDNCLSSEFVQQTLDIGRFLKATTGTESVTSDVTRTYNGIPTVLSIGGDVADDYTCQWFCDGVYLDGKDGKTLTITDVGNHRYTCNYKVGDTVSFTNSINVNIEKRPLVLSANTAQKTYDGTALTCSDYTVGGSSLDDKVLENYATDLHRISLNMTSSSTQTDAGSKDNEIDTSTIHIYRKEADNTEVDVTGNYTITTAKGTLTVDKRSITITAVSEQNKDYLCSDPSAYTYTVAYGSDATEEMIEDMAAISGALSRAAGEDAGSYQITQGTITDANNSNYTITYIPANFTINKIDLQNNTNVSIATIPSRMYDDTEYKPTPTVTYTAEGSSYTLVSGTDFEYSYSNNINVTTDASKAVLTITGKDANFTSSRSVNYVITKRDVTFTGNTDTVKYDGKEHSVNTYTVSGSGLVSGHKDDVVYLASGTDANDYTGSITSANDVKITKGDIDVTSNYAITTSLGKLTIQKRNISFTGETATKEYTGSELSITGITVGNDGLAEGQTYSASYLAKGTEASATAYAGTITSSDAIKIKQGDTDVTDNYIITSTPGSLTINKTASSFTVSLPTSTYTYDGDEHYNDKTASSDAITGKTSFEYSLDNSSFTDDLTSLTKKDAGTYKMYVKASNPNYSNVMTCESSIVIDKRNITVTADENQSKVFGQKDPDLTRKFTVVYENITSSEQIAKMAAIVGELKRTTGEDVNKYSINQGTVTNDNNANYLITYVSKDFEIVKKNIDDADGVNGKIVVTMPSESLTYNGQAQTVAPVVKYVPYDGASEISLEKDKDYTLSFENNTNAGQATVKITGINNYDKTISRNYTIAKKLLTITAKNYQIKYHQTAANDGVGYDGFVNSEDESVLTGSISYTYLYKTGDTTKAYDTDSPVGDYSINITGYSSNNYDIKYVPGTLKVINEDITGGITQSGTLVYNGTAQIPVISSSLSSVNSQSIKVQYSTDDNNYYDDLPSFTYVKDGGYTVYYKAVADNHNELKNSFVVTVNPISSPITVKADSKDKTYDGTALTCSTYTFTDGVLLSGDTLSAVTQGSITDYKEGGVVNSISSYTVKNAVDVDVTNCYTFSTSESGTLSINKRAVKLKSDSATKEFDGKAITNKNVSVTEGSFASGEGATYTFPDTSAQLYVGSCENKFTYDFNSGTKAENYNISVEYGKLEITNKSDKNIATVTANSGSFTYDGQQHSVSGFNNEVSGKGIQVDVSGKTFYVSGLESSANATHVSDSVAKITVNGTATVKSSDGVDWTDQFIVQIVEGSLTITKVPVEIIANSKNKEYDTTALVDSGYTVSGSFVGEEGFDTVTVSGSQTIPGSSANTVTAYTFKSNTDSNDYNVSKTDGTLKVENRTTPFAVEVTGKSDSITYDGVEHKVEGFINETLNGIEIKVNSSTLYVNGLKNTASGKYFDDSKDTVISGTTKVTDSNGNDVTSQFTVTKKTGKLTINPVSSPITIKADSADKTYDSTALTCSTYTYTDGVLLSGDTLTAVTQGSITNYKEGGEANSISSYAVKNADNVDVTNCYTFNSSVDGTLVINKSALTVSWPDKLKFYYDTEEHKVVPTVKGIVNDEIEVEIEKDSATDIGKYLCKITLKPQTADTLNNYILPDESSLSKEWEILENIGKLIISTDGGDINDCRIYHGTGDTLTANLQQADYDLPLIEPTYTWYRTFNSTAETPYWVVIATEKISSGNKLQSTYKLVDEDAGSLIKCVVEDAVLSNPVTSDNNALVSLYFTEGDNQTYTTRIDTEKGAAFKTNGQYNIDNVGHLKSVLVDDKTLTDQDFEAKAGSTEIKLLGSYLDKLSEGQHVLSAVYEYDNDSNPSEKTIKAKFNVSNGTRIIKSSYSGPGTIYPLGEKTVIYGADQEYMFVPKTNYYVYDVIVDGTSVTVYNNRYTFTNVTSDHTIEVVFKHVSVPPKTGDDIEMDDNIYLMSISAFCIYLLLAWNKKNKKRSSK